MINLKKIKTSDVQGLPQDVWLREAYGGSDAGIALYCKLNGYAADEELLCGLIFKNYQAAFRPVCKV